MPSLELAASVNSVGIKPGTSQWARSSKLSPSLNASVQVQLSLFTFLSCWSETFQRRPLLDGHVNFDLLCAPWQKDNFHDDQKVSAVLIFTSFLYSPNTFSTCSDNNGTVLTSHQHLNFIWTIIDHWFQYWVFIFRENESCVFMQCCCPSELTIVLLGCSVSTSTQQFFFFYRTDSLECFDLYEHENRFSEGCRVEMQN